MNEPDNADPLATLLSLDRPALVEEWRKVFGHTAPRSAQVRLLRGVLAWHRQADGDSNGTVKQLTRQLRGWSAHAVVASLKPGTRLLREWKGETHHVTVAHGGFVYDGQKHKSLTAVTRKITGMGWSGPLFFGLRK
jgi:hypothetical protein